MGLAIQSVTSAYIAVAYAPLCALASFRKCFAVPYDQAGSGSQCTWAAVALAACPAFLEQYADE